MVEIDGTVYEVYTDGADHRDVFLDELSEPDITLLPPIPTFDPVTGTLTIPAELLTEETQSVIISASAEMMEEEECICEIRCIEVNETCPICKDSIEGCIGNEDLFEVMEIIEITEETDSAETAESDEVIDLTEEGDSAEENDFVESNEPDEIIVFTENADVSENSGNAEIINTEPSGAADSEIMEFSITIDAVSENLAEGAEIIEEIIVMEP